MKRYMVRIEVEAEPDDTTRLRALLPTLLQNEGYTTTTGTTIIEAWYVEATNDLHRQNGIHAPAHGGSDWMPVGRARRRPSGHGPQP